MHVDLDLARPGGSRGSGLPAQRVEAARPAARQGQRLRSPRQARRQTGAQPQDVAPVRGPDDLGLLALGRQLIGDLPGVLAGSSAGGEVEQMNREPRQFIDEHAGEAPEGGPEPTRPTCQRQRSRPAGRRR